ncbi:MAG: FAD-dependent monooxygenase [Rhodospirillaceae bacterium]|nr:FAD-dependent monooxygenase [Rhodospirillaceae bacterium]
MDEQNIVIIGAGIGGLSTALALQKFGFQPKVYERASLLGEIGAGIMLTPNAVKALCFLGLENALDHSAVEPVDSVYRRFDTAEEVLRSPLKDKMQAAYGARYFHVHRADLHKNLLDAVLAQDPSAIHVDHEFERLEQGPNSIKAWFASGASIEAALLIGCDGIHSRVRGALYGDENPRFTGQMAWRGMVPAQGLPDTVTEPVSVSWLGEHKHIIQYGVRDRQFINYVAIVATEEWTEEGWNRPADVDEVVSAFEGWHEDVLTLLKSTPEGNCYKWGLFDRDPLDHWTQGRVTLLGDAAHPMLPFMAQGSAMAIEDAVVLGRSLTSHSSIDTALAHYEKERRERTSLIVQKSRQATNLYQRLTGDKSEQRASNLDFLYGYDAATVSI